MCNLNFMGGIDTGVVATCRHPITDVKRTGTTFLMAHNFEIATWAVVHWDQLLDGSFTGTYSPPYWNKGLNVYFVDGHIEFLTYKGPGQSRWYDPDPPSLCPNCSFWFGCGYTIYDP
jgi:prepilin-type processing-associated H-X9-DG protein